MVTPSKHYVNNFNISKTFKGVSNTLPNFTFMGATVFEIAGGGGGGRLEPPLVKGVGTKRLGKGRIKDAAIIFCFSIVMNAYS